MNKSKQKGFSLIEIILSSMFIAMVFIPLMISLSRIQNRYLNLKSHFYAQLIAQTDMEVFSNLMQGKNPTGAVGSDAYNWPIDEIFSVNGTSNLTNTVLAGTGIKKNFSPPSLPTPPPPIPLPTAKPKPNLVEIATFNASDNKNINNTTYQRRIVAYPVCRNPTLNLIIDGSENSPCPSGTILDNQTIEVVSEISWTPPGTTTQNLNLKTIFTAYMPVIIP